MFQIKEELIALVGEESRLDGLFCSASNCHPVSSFSEMSSRPPRILLNADPSGPPTLAPMTKEAALLRR